LSRAVICTAWRLTCDIRRYALLFEGVVFRALACRIGGSVSGKGQVAGCGSVEYEFGCGGLPLGGPGRTVLPELVEGCLDAPGGGGCDVLVEGKCLFQAGGGFAGAAVAEVAVAHAFQGACFLCGGADLAGDGQRLGVVVAGLVAIVGPAR